MTKYGFAKHHYERFPNYFVFSKIAYFFINQ